MSHQRLCFSLVLAGAMILGTLAWFTLRDKDKERETTPLRNVITLNRKGSFLQCITFSPDGSLLACGNLLDVRRGEAVSTITVWDIAARKERAFLRQPVEFSGLAFSPDGKWLAASGGKAIHLWDTSTWKERLAPPGHTSLVGCLAFAPDGTALAWGDYEGGVIVWDLAKGKQRLVLTGHLSFVEEVAFSPDGRFLASAGNEGPINLWDLSTGKTVWSVRGDAHTQPTTGVLRVNALAFAPDGKSFATAGLDRVVRVWDVAAGKERAAFPVDNPERISSLAYSPNGKLLAASSAGGKAPGYVQLWDVATGRTLANRKTPVGGIYRIRFSPDGKTLAVGNGSPRDGSVQLWDVAELLRDRQGEKN